MRVDDVVGKVWCGPSAGSAPETPSSQGSGSDPRPPTDRPRRAKQQVVPATCCSLRRLTHCKPSFVESSGAL
jgi:hypothetical protein